MLSMVTVSSSLKSELFVVVTDGVYFCQWNASFCPHVYVPELLCWARQKRPAWQGQQWLPGGVQQAAKQQPVLPQDARPTSSHPSPRGPLCQRCGTFSPTPFWPCVSAVWSGSTVSIEHSWQKRERTPVVWCARQVPVLAHNSVLLKKSRVTNQCVFLGLGGGGEQWDCQILS